MPAQHKGIDLDGPSPGERPPRGETHLLVMAIDEYAHCPRLSNCVKDARDLVRLLQERYQLAPERTYALYDQEATRAHMLQKLRELRDKVGENDSLLVFFSGHGEVADDEAFWVPVEGKPAEDWDWVPADRIKRLLGAVNAFHTLVIVDACFAGSFFVSYKTAAQGLLQSRRSRLGMSASHSRERALDGQPGENSPFARVLLRILRYNQQPLPADQLYSQVRDAVVQSTSGRQTPIFKNIDIRGDDQGQYVFTPGLDEAAAWARCKAEGTRVAYQGFLAQFPESPHAAAAQAQIAILAEEADWQQAQAQGTIAAYLSYRGRYPSGAHRQAALSAIEKLEDEQDWRLAQQRDALSAYLTYQAKHPQGQHRAAADQAIQRLASAAEPAPAPAPPPPKPQPKPEPTPQPAPQPAVPKMVYGQPAPASPGKPRPPRIRLIAAGVLLGLALLLALWGIRQCNRPEPGSPSAMPTELLLEQLDAAMQARSLEEVEGLRDKASQLPDSPEKAAQMKRVDAWIMAYADSLKVVKAAQAAADAAIAAIAANTIPAYEAFLNGPHRNSEQAPDIRRRRDALKEAAGFQAARTANTRQAYDTYLAKWPNGSNAAEARRLREEIPPPPPTAIAKLEADMLRVAGGTFTMGCQSAARDGECYDREKPPRQVRVPAFSIGKHEVTQAQWRAVMGRDPSNNKGCDDCPVEQVSWDDIQDFLRKLNAQTGKRYRLPTEAEWEYAARGGSQSRGYLYSGGNNIGEVGWYEGNAKQGNTYGAQKTTRPVGQKKANELGLYDMSGNVWEWCEDDWHVNYNGAPTDGRAWVNSPRGGRRVLRGGSWNYGTRACRVAYRSGSYPATEDIGGGFRLARD